MFIGRKSAVGLKVKRNEEDAVVRTAAWFSILCLTCESNKGRGAIFVAASSVGKLFLPAGCVMKVHICSLERWLKFW